MPSTTDPVSEFLTAVAAGIPSGSWGHLWTAPGRRTYWFADPDDAASHVLRHCSNADTYCGIAFSDRRGRTDQRILSQPDPRRPDGILAAGIVALTSDVDIAGAGHSSGKHYPPDLDAALALVGAIPLRPTMLVHSGGGLQAWWLLREPWTFDADEDREKGRELLRGWGAAVAAVASRKGFDLDAVHDLSRVMRVAGTVNCKGPDAKWSPDRRHRRPVVLLECHDDRRYNPEDFERFCPNDCQEAPAFSRTHHIPLGNFPAASDPDLLRRFGALLSHDERLAATWRRTRRDLRDGSASGYDLALASRLAVKYRWTAGEVAWAISHSRHQHPDDKPLHAGKLESTVGKAMAAVTRAPK